MNKPYSAVPAGFGKQVKNKILGHSIDIDNNSSYAIYVAISSNPNAYSLVQVNANAGVNSVGAGLQKERNIPIQQLKVVEAGYSSNVNIEDSSCYITVQEKEIISMNLLEQIERQIQEING